MAYVVFDKSTRGYRSNGPRISISATGLRLNTAAIRALGPSDFVNVMFDPDRNLLCIRRADGTNRDLDCRLTRQKGSAFVSCSPFVRRYALTDVGNVDLSSPGGVEALVGSVSRGGSST